MSGPVCKGFGRGGKLLGCPTANIDPAYLVDKLDSLDTGIYFGWAKLHNNDPRIYPMCTSIGWNPTFNNKSKTVEPHILHEFTQDFYDVFITILICGYIRPELKFQNIELLADWIKQDKAISTQALESGEYDALKDSYFKNKG